MQTHDLFPLSKPIDLRLILLITLFIVEREKVRVFHDDPGSRWRYFKGRWLFFLKLIFILFCQVSREDVIEGVGYHFGSQNFREGVT